MTLKPGAKSSPKLNIDWLKSQTKKVQKEVLETLTTLSEPEAQALIWSWSFWARQDQLPPPGHWTSWMMLGGRNLLAIETGTGWEVVQFTTAELTSTRHYRLSGLLRGAYGSDAAMVPSIPAGASFCVIDKSLTPLDIMPENLTEHLSLRYGPGGLPPDSYGWRTGRHALRRFAVRCLRPVHLKAVGGAGADIHMSWHLGIAADKKKFANAAPVARDTIVTGLANPPEAIWANTPVVVTPSEGTLTAGRIAFAVFTLRLPVLDAV